MHKIGYNIRIHLGPMNNTTRHKIGEIQLELTVLPQRGPGRSPGTFSTFMFLEGKIQHLINIPAPNLLKLTSRKRDIHERKYVNGE